MNCECIDCGGNAAEHSPGCAYMRETFGVTPVLNPAGSFDFGTQCWAMADDIETTDTLGHYVVDAPTAQLGHDRIEAAYADYCKENYL